MAYSNCKRYDVFAMGIDKDGKVISTRNGNPGKCRNTVGNCGCIHAEASLIRKMNNPISVVVSHSPCLECAKLLVGHGVKTVSYLKPYRITDGVDYLIKNGVHVIDLLGMPATGATPFDTIAIKGDLNI